MVLVINVYSKERGFIDAEITHEHTVAKVFGVRKLHLSKRQSGGEYRHMASPMK